MSSDLSPAKAVCRPSVFKTRQTSSSAGLILSALLRKDRKDRSEAASDVRVMTLLMTDKYLTDLVSDLSESFLVFSNEAEKLRALLARSETPVAPESYEELRKQCIAEVKAFEEYLNRKEEIFTYLNVKSRSA
jgi:hypothetical protein